MIFVTLGTQDKQFVRLLEAVEKLDIDEKIVAQIGTTDFKSKKMKLHKFLSKDEIDKYMNEARIIISHAGVGTIIEGLKLHKKMIVAARKKEYKEHVNNHQEQILNTFSDAGFILALNNFDDLQELIEKDFTPKDFESNTKKFNKNLSEEIKKLITK